MQVRSQAPHRHRTATGTTRRLHVGIIASVRHGIRQPHAGGLERHTADLAVGLRERGHRVTVFASADSDPELGVVPICTRESALDLSPAAREDVSMLAESFMEEHHAYLNLMLDLPSMDVDIVHDNSLHHLPVAMAKLLAVPLVKVLHTPPTPWLESALSRRDPRTTVVSVSAANARRWLFPVDRVIHNGVDLSAFGVGPGGGPAVWSGRLVPEKGAHLALQAAHLADVDLLLAGPVSDTEYLNRHIRPLLDDRRRLVGHLNRHELAPLLGAASVAVVTPRWEEPYGLVVAEALACGTPVAAFDRGAIAEITTPGTACLAPADDVAALAEAIRQAMTLERDGCRRQAETTAGTQAMIDRYVALYEDLCRRVDGDLAA